MLFSTNERFLKGDERRGLVDGGRREEREKERKKFGRVGWRGRVKKKQKRKASRKFKVILTIYFRGEKAKQKPYPLFFFQEISDAHFLPRESRSDPNQGFDLGSNFCVSPFRRRPASFSRGFFASSSFVSSFLFVATKLSLSFSLRLTSHESPPPG